MPEHVRESGNKLCLIECTYLGLRYHHFPDIQPKRRLLDVQLFHARRMLFYRRAHRRLCVRFMRRACQNAGRRQVGQRRTIQHANRDEAVVAVGNNEGACSNG